MLTKPLKREEQLQGGHSTLTCGTIPKDLRSSHGQTPGVGKPPLLPVQLPRGTLGGRATAPEKPRKTAVCFAPSPVCNSYLPTKLPGAKASQGKDAPWGGWSGCCVETLEDLEDQSGAAQCGREPDSGCRLVGRGLIVIG